MEERSDDRAPCKKKMRSSEHYIRAGRTDSSAKTECPASKSWPLLPFQGILEFLPSRCVVAFGRVSSRCTCEAKYHLQLRQQLPWVHVRTCFFSTLQGIIMVFSLSANCHDRVAVAVLPCVFLSARWIASFVVRSFFFLSFFASE